MSDWKPPKFGFPVWMGIPATDLDRAAKFYETVFKFPFMNDDQPATYAKDEMRMFKFYPDLNLSGAIQRVPEPSGLMHAGRGGICMYWFVEDVDATGELVEQAGGKMLGGVEKEGKTGIYRFFEDTEGNVGAAYQMVESNEAL